MRARKQGLLQAAGVTLYCLFIGLVLGQENSLIPKLNPVFGPILFLLVFCTSALVCALIVFYKPYKLFFDGEKREALDTVVYTASFLGLFAVFFLMLLVLFK